ncbi:MAG: SAM-dependent methyltransferase [Pseudomonadota bacterium]
MSEAPRGRLSLVGSGIRPAGQLTVETRHLIEGADHVFCVVDALTLRHLQQINPRTQSLQDCYAVGRSRDDSYSEMIERMLVPLDDGDHVVGVFYGHPGVFVWPGHEAARRAQVEGHAATMYPGISAEDCLVADLGLDPAVQGCQSYECSDFLLYPRRIEPTALLILWQPAALGDLTRSSFETDPSWVQALAEVLAEDYPDEHPVIVYEAASFPLADPRIDRVALSQLHEVEFTQQSTLVLTPIGPPERSQERLARLGVTPEDIATASFQRYREVTD